MGAVAGAIPGASHSPTRQSSPPAACLGAGKAEETFFQLCLFSRDNFHSPVLILKQINHELWLNKVTLAPFDWQRGFCGGITCLLVFLSESWFS